MIMSININTNPLLSSYLKSSPMGVFVGNRSIPYFPFPSPIATFPLPPPSPSFFLPPYQSNQSHSSSCLPPPQFMHTLAPSSTLHSSHSEPPEERRGGGGGEREILTQESNYGIVTCVLSTT